MAINLRTFRKLSSMPHYMYSFIFVLFFILSKKCHLHEVSSVIQQNGMSTWETFHTPSTEATGPRAVSQGQEDQARKERAFPSC